MIDSYRPLQSLKKGCWFKLICGASFQYLPAVRSLALAYTLAGADCIDVAADPAVIAAAREGVRAAKDWVAEANYRGYGVEGDPWLMVSLNDGEDPHFRKAAFDPTRCPADCPRPCEAICPAQAIAFAEAPGFSGVIDSRCYGCGRCIPICPVQQIVTRSYVAAPAVLAPLVLDGVDAVELHTQVGRLADFERLWQAIAPYTDQLKLVAISCPDGEGVLDYLWAIHRLIGPLPCAVVWQTDGRPMSGDIGDGATRAAVKFGQKVLSAGLPGYIQLAGGTNRHTVPKLRALGLLNDTGAGNPQSAINNGQSTSAQFIAGVAYGSYARVLLSPILEQLEQTAGDPRIPAFRSSPSRMGEEAIAPIFPVGTAHLELHPHLLWQAVDLANSLVSQIKFRSAPQPTNSSSPSHTHS